MKKLIVLAVPAVAGLALLGSGSRAAPPQLVRIAPTAAIEAAPPVTDAPVAAPVVEAEAPAPAPVVSAPSQPAKAHAPAAAAPAEETATPDTEPPTPATEPPAPEFCPKDGTVYVAGSCTLDPTVMPSGAPDGTHVKYCSDNSECPADFPDPGEGRSLTNCREADYHTCDSYTPAP